MFLWCHHQRFVFFFPWEKPQHLLSDAVLLVLTKVFTLGQLVQSLRLSWAPMDSNKYLGPQKLRGWLAECFKSQLWKVKQTPDWHWEVLFLQSVFSFHHLDLITLLHSINIPKGILIKYTAVNFPFLPKSGARSEMTKGENSHRGSNFYWSVPTDSFMGGAFCGSAKHLLQLSDLQMSAGPKNRCARRNPSTFIVILLDCEWLSPNGYILKRSRPWWECPWPWEGLDLT